MAAAVLAHAVLTTIDPEKLQHTPYWFERLSVLLQLHMHVVLYLHFVLVTTDHTGSSSMQQQCLFPEDGISSDGYLRFRNAVAALLQTHSAVHGQLLRDARAKQKCNQLQLCHDVMLRHYSSINTKWT